LEFVDGADPSLGWQPPLQFEDLGVVGRDDENIFELERPLNVVLVYP
jgi:hypothetical protein